MTTLYMLEKDNFIHKIFFEITVSLWNSSWKRSCKCAKIKEVNAVLTTKTCWCVLCLCISEVYGSVVSSQARSCHSSTLWHAYTYQVLTHLYCMLLQTALYVHKHTHTHAHSDTHLCTGETHHYGNTEASSDSGKVQNVHVMGTEG